MAAARERAGAIAAEGRARVAELQRLAEPNLERAVRAVLDALVPPGARDAAGGGGES